MSSTAETDAEDVNDFLRRIQELGTKRDQEDEERNRRLEEEIIQGRKERQARRAERARSISPTKDSPVNTPNAADRAGTSKITLSPPPELQPTAEVPMRDVATCTSMERLSSQRSPGKEDTTPCTESERTSLDTDLQAMNSIKGSPSSAMLPSRNSPLSWQRRPTSDQPRSRPLSMIAAENAARSPRATPEPVPQIGDQTPTSHDQFVQMLGSKDPAWFRQTAERGENSPAYRKNQVEDIDVVDIVSSPRLQLPGMSREPSRSLGSVSGSSVDMDSSISPSRNSSSIGAVERGLFSGIGSPVPLTNAQRLDPPLNSALDDLVGSRRPLAMSPSQGRISPERGDRPMSPTKGMGGFVQSAMMKRSDSVSKRWSVQSPPGLSRGNSIASSRSSADPTASQSSAGLLGREPRPSSVVSRDNSPPPLSRPTSSHGAATILQDSEQLGTSNSMRSSMTTSTANDGFAKPALPANRSQLSSTIRENDLDSIKSSQSETTPPSSPSRPIDTRRWSPTKSSWLENALNKPESPKPKLAPVPPQQPAWMSEISKAKQRNNVESAGSPPVHKHEVNIDGLLRSPPPGGLTKPSGIGGLPVCFSSGSMVRKTSPSGDIRGIPSQVKGPPSSSTPLDGTTAHKLEDAKSAPLSTPKGSIPSNGQPPSSGKVKPETPPRKDFRANLKPRQIPSDNEDKQAPEFKNVFGQLRRTKTQNYVAPDELKDNILRGKAGLNVTGGPKKTERKDEFKEAILKKKDDFKKAQLEGTGFKRSTSDSSQKAAAPLPEALVKKAVLGRINNIAIHDSSPANNSVKALFEEVPKQTLSKEPPAPSPRKEISAPGIIQSKDVAAGKSVENFNTALATLIAKGSSSTASDTSQTSSPVPSQRTVSASTGITVPDEPGSGPQLMHMTKSRARGPRRKAPSTLTVTNQTSMVGEISESTTPAMEASLKQVQGEHFPAAGGKKSNIAPPLVQDKSENEVSQPTSPKKLDIKRRSRFLEEVSNQNDKTLQKVESAKPISQKKKADIEELSVTKQGLKVQALDQKAAPSAKPKSSTLTPMVTRELGEQGVPTNSEQNSSETTSTPPHISSLLPKNSRKLNSLADVMDRSPLVDSAVDAGSVLSVKNSAALFNRQIAKEDTHQSTGIKPPITLPTQEDENAAMLGAGLISPGLSSTMATTITVLNRLGPNTSPSTVGKKGNSIVPQVARKTNETVAAAENSGRQTPSSVSKVPMSPPPGADNKPASPRKMIIQAVPHSSEASKLLIDFFGKKDFAPNPNIDTAAILSARPCDPPKIKTLRSQLFHLSGDGKKQQVPNHQERILFENNMYICSHTFGTPAGKKVIEVYFWTGDMVPESSAEDALLFAQREAKTAGGKLVRLKQGQETSEFIEALGGIMITRRGSSNKYDSLAPHILCGRRYAGQIVFDEVDFSPSSLCSGFPYLISTQSGTCYLWKGKGSLVDELSCARLIGMDFGLTGELEEVEDGNEPTSFLNIFGNETRILKSADHWRLKPNYPQYRARLFYANPSSKSQITEIHPFTQHFLSPTQIYILDAFFEIYIIVGSASQSEYSAFCTALLFAQEYGILAAGMEDRPFVPVSTVVLEGVPRDLKAVFRKWREDVGPNVAISSKNSGRLQRGMSLRVVPLNAALDATRF